MAGKAQHLSQETKQLLEGNELHIVRSNCLLMKSLFIAELSIENGLSVVKRKGLVEHLVRVSQQPRGCQEAYGPRQRPFIKRSRTHLDSVTSLRKKDTIVQSGAYERSKIAPPKGKGNILIILVVLCFVIAIVIWAGFLFEGGCCKKLCPLNASIHHTFSSSIGTMLVLKALDAFRPKAMTWNCKVPIEWPQEIYSNELHSLKNVWR